MSDAIDAVLSVEIQDGVEDVVVAVVVVEIVVNEVDVLTLDEVDVAPSTEKEGSDGATCWVAEAGPNPPGAATDPIAPKSAVSICGNPLPRPASKLPV